MAKELIQEVRERLSIFIDLYDSIRIVDPIKKEIIGEEGKINTLGFFKNGNNCYDF